MSTITELGTEPFYLKLILYGRYGSGKTYQVGELAKSRGASPVLLIRAEDGAATIDDREGIYATPMITHVSQVRDYVYRVAHRQKTQELDYGSIGTIAVDSLSALYDMALREAVDKACAAKPDKDPDIPSLRDYGVANFVMKRLIVELFALPLHVIATALLREEIPEGRVSASYRGPQLPPALRQAALATSNYTWALHVDGEGRRTIRTRPHGVWDIKTRRNKASEKLPDLIPDPDLSKIFAFMRKAHTKKATTPNGTNTESTANE